MKVGNSNMNYLMNSLFFLNFEVLKQSSLTTERMSMKFLLYSISCRFSLEKKTYFGRLKSPQDMRLSKQELKMIRDYGLGRNILSFALVKCFSLDVS